MWLYSIFQKDDKDTMKVTTKEESNENTRLLDDTGDEASESEMNDTASEVGSIAPIREPDTRTVRFIKRHNTTKRYRSQRRASMMQRQRSTVYPISPTYDNSFVNGTFFNIQASTRLYMTVSKLFSFSLKPRHY